MKSCWAVSFAPETMLFIISKEKLKLNITMEPETIYRYQLMVEKSEHRAKQMKAAISSLKQVLTVAINNGLTANQIKLTENSLHQTQLVEKLESSMPIPLAPPKSSTERYPEIALAVLIKNMEDSLSRKQELQALIKKQEGEAEDQKFDLNLLPSEFFVSNTGPKKQTLHKKKLDDRNKQEKEFVKRLEESLATGSRFQVKSDTPSEGKTNFLKFALKRVRGTFEEENIKNRTNYSLLVTSRSEEIGQAIDEHKKRIRSDHLSHDNSRFEDVRNARSVDDRYEDRLAGVLRKKYLAELERVAGKYHEDPRTRRKLHLTNQLELSADIDPRIFQTEPAQYQTENTSKSRSIGGMSAKTRTLNQSHLRVIMSRRVLLREDSKPAVQNKESSSQSKNPHQATYSTFGMSGSSRGRFLPFQVKSLMANKDPRALPASQRKIEPHLILPRMTKLSSTVDIMKNINKQAALTITKF